MSPGCRGFHYHKNSSPPHTTFIFYLHIAVSKYPLFSKQSYFLPCVLYKEQKMLSSECLNLWMAFTKFVPFRQNAECHFTPQTQTLTVPLHNDVIIEPRQPRARRGKGVGGLLTDSFWSEQSWKAGLQRCWCHTCNAISCHVMWNDCWIVAVNATLSLDNYHCSAGGCGQYFRFAHAHKNMDLVTVV